MEIGVVNGTGGGATVRYTHTDQLTGSNIITNGSNTKDETLDYFPFGSVRIDSGTYGDQRKFAGHEYDTDTQLSYQDARYYDGSRGQFLSEDPAFLAIGDPGQFKSIAQQSMFAFLSDPQRLNSYSYVENNPITKMDPTGQFSINPIGFLSNNTQITIGNWANNVAASSPTFNYVTGHKWVGYTAGGIGIAAGAGAGILYGGAVLGYTTLGQLCLFVCGNASNQIQNTVNATQNARDALMNGTNDPQLKGIINQLYRQNATVGDGGTADALRYETETGNLLSKSGHLEKATGRITELTRYLGQDNLSSQDRQLGQSLLNNLKDAVKSATQKK
jgi:filamentous hemagglutinin